MAGAGETELAATLRGEAYKVLPFPPPPCLPPSAPRLRTPRSPPSASSSSQSLSHTISLAPLMSNQAPSATTVHLEQLDARDCKQPRKDAVDIPLDIDMDVDDEQTGSRLPETSMVDVSSLSSRRLSIDVAAARASCSLGNPASPSYASTRPASPSAGFRPSASSASSSASSSSSSTMSSPITASASPSASRTAKCPRLSPLTHSLPPSPITPTERHRRKQRRRELGSKKRLARLYNKRMTSQMFHLPTRLPNAFGRSKASAPPSAHPHFLGEPHAHPHAHVHSQEDFSISPLPSVSSLGQSTSASAPSSSASSPSSSSLAAAPLAALQFRRRASSPSVLQSVPAGPSTTQNCLHQTCVAFRFASMIDGVQLSSLSTSRTGAPSQSRSGSFFVPPILPPINRYTLQELDLDAIMKNPQLRHDLLFDAGLQFRPTESKRKRETTDMYWCTIKSEIEAGCSCVSFDESRHMHRHVCRCPTNLRNANLLISGTDHLPCEESLPIHVPSRVAPLIEELREVVLAVVFPPPPPIPIRSSAVPGQAPNSPLRPRRLSALDPSNIAWLYEAFDVPLIVQQLRHGIFDLGKLLLAVGELLREHCAPARDAMLDAMLSIADKCRPGREGHLIDALAAIRMCFELLEFMRLDSANHLLAHLRPHLLASAPQFEGVLFERLGSSFPTTRTWLSEAYAKISSTKDYSSADGTLLPPPDQVGNLSSAQKIVATFLPALVELVLFPPNPTSPSLPASPTTTPVSKVHQSYQVTMQPGYPETLYLDHSRLLLLTADAADITANAMFLAVYRQLVFSTSIKNGKRAPPMSDEKLTTLKQEIQAVGSSRPGLCFCRDYTFSKPERAAEPLQIAHWRKDMQATALHVAHAVELAGQDGTAAADEDTGSRFRPPSSELLQSVSNWSATNMRPGTVVSSVFRKKIASALLRHLIPRFFALWNAGIHHRAGFFSSNPISAAEFDAEMLKPKSGLEPLDEEIRVLAERLAKLAVLHLRVFFPLYEQSSILPSSI